MAITQKETEDDLLNIDHNAEQGIDGDGNSKLTKDEQDLLVRMFTRRGFQVEFKEGKLFLTKNDREFWIREKVFAKPEEI